MILKIKVELNHPLFLTPAFLLNKTAWTFPQATVHTASWYFIRGLCHHLFNQPPTVTHLTYPDFSPTANNPAK